MTVVVVPIAGWSSRFAKYTNTPKWSIYIGSRPSLSIAVQALEEIDDMSCVIVAYRPAQAHWLNTCRKFLSLDKVGIQYVPIGEHSTGQADTVRQALTNASVDQNEPLIVWNGDSTLLAGWNEHSVETAGSGLLVAQLKGDHWSFVAQTDTGGVHVEEKVRISEDACLGLYVFRSVSTFQSLVFPNEGETFVGPLYNQLSASGDPVSIHRIDPSLFLPFGTPEEMVQACDKLKVSRPPELAPLENAPTDSL